MSNENEIKPDVIDEEVEKATDDLRGDNWKMPQTQQAAPSLPFKQKIHDPNSPPATTLTPEQIIEVSKIVHQKTAEAIKNAKYNPNADFQILSKANAPVTDFSKITIDDVYDLTVNIEAKPFMSADVLEIHLKDTNYEPRWVNKNPQRLGDYISKGFQYIVPDDLHGEEAIKASLDAEGHYSIHDVVAMKIDKATYYRALRAAHERAIATTNETMARKRAANQANQFMGRGETYKNAQGQDVYYNPGDFAQARGTSKMEFYDPGISA